MITSLALRLFGAYFRARRNKFSAQSEALRKIDKRMSIDTWLSLATFYSLVMALFFVPIFILAWRLAFGNFLVWDALKGLPGAPLSGILRLSGELLLLIPAAFFSFLVWRFLFNQYLVAIVWERRMKIDGKLPYAIGWMASLASVGIIPFEIFKKLAATEEYYGEVSKEARRLVRDVEILGMDFMSALRHLATVTPSEHLRTFLQGAITSALSGGEMGSYFVAKAEEYMEENRRQFNDYINTLGMLSEIYIIAIIAGPLFIIVMFAAMMMLSGASPMLLKIIVYAAIPLGATMFIMLADVMTPAGIK
ncbi:MAG: type II secretion system F family protein [Chloroflexi bacterium]|nr:type II secretion system F family protein [Chloroflexota bacterium]